MPLVLIWPPQFTCEQYEELVRRLRPGSKVLASPSDWPVEGLLVHVAGEDPNGFRVVEVSGTSFAAPHVSFAAALLRAAWPMAVPSRIKRRILSGADISPLLDPNKVSYSRKLDIVKTLAIYQDVVEAVVDGTARRIRGTLDESHELFNVCSNAPDLWRHFQPGRNTVRKIARVTVPNEGLLVDWENQDGEFKTDICAPQYLSIGITEEDTNRHFDIAGPAFLQSGDTYRGKGGTGVGVRLMVEFFKSLLK